MNGQAFSLEFTMQDVTSLRTAFSMWDGALVVVRVLVVAVGAVTLVFDFLLNMLVVCLVIELFLVEHNVNTNQDWMFDNYNDVKQ